MRLIKPSAEIIEQKPGLDGLLQHIERCGRTCYKSEDKITNDSAPKFVDMLVKRGHTAMVEHGTVYLHRFVDYSEDPSLEELAEEWHSKYAGNQYSRHSIIDHCKEQTIDIYITTNYRVLLQNGWLDDLKYQCEPTEHHVKRITVKFICDRGVSHEFVRHRVFSFAQESTRYCNYSKDKFGKECTFIIPSWLDIPEGHYDLDWDVIDNAGNSCSYPYPEDAKSVSYWYNDLSKIAYAPVMGEHLESSELRDTYLSALTACEEVYFRLLEQGWIAQQARAVLPNSLKTELIMTGTIEQWEGFFKLRCANDAHPQARELAVPLYGEFVKRGYVTARISKEGLL